METSLKKYKIVVLLFFSMFLLTSCNRNVEITETTIEVNKDNSITYTIIEAFDQSYYSLEELKAMNEEEVESFNKANNEENVSIVSTEVIENQIKLIMKYNSYESFRKMQDRVFFVGTVKEAKTAKFDFSSTFISIKNGEVVPVEDVLEHENLKVVILKNNCDVVMYKNIMYISDNVEVTKDKKLVKVKEEELSYIILK
ncbi:MAG: hypothetical protein ACRC7V_07080 [Lachnospiraceae bacterium]